MLAYPLILTLGALSPPPGIGSSLTRYLTGLILEARTYFSLATSSVPRTLYASTNCKSDTYVTRNENKKKKTYVFFRGRADVDADEGGPDYEGEEEDEGEGYAPVGYVAAPGRLFLDVVHAELLSRAVSMLQRHDASGWVKQKKKENPVLQKIVFT